jgi:hypothetical protein
MTIAPPIPWRVIRAAPDLLEANEAGLEYIDASQTSMAKLHLDVLRDLWVEKARAAIAKAKGEKE